MIRLGPEISKKRPQEVLSAMRSIAIAAVLVAFLSSAVEAVPLGSLSQLTNTSVLSSKEEIKIRFSFRKGADYSKLRKFSAKNSIFIDLPKSYIQPARQTIKVGDDLLSAIELYQFQADEVRIGLVLTKRVDELKERFSISAVEGNLEISIKKGDSPDQGASAGGVENNAEGAQAQPGVQQDALKPIESVPKQVLPDQTRPALGALKASADEILASVIMKNSDRDENEETLFPDLLYEPPGLSSVGLEDKARPFSGPSAQGPDAKVAQDGFASRGLPDLFSASFKIAVASAILLTALIAAAYLAKRYFPRRMTRAGKDKLIKILATSHIGPKKAIALVQIGGAELVLGIAGDSITMLAKLETPTSDEEFDDQLDQAARFSASEKSSDDVEAEEGSDEEVEQSIASLADSIRDRISRLKKI